MAFSRGQAAAKVNGRDIIEPFDLPITKGLQERVHEFETINQEVKLKPVLEHLTARPPPDLGYSEDTDAELPRIAGGPSVALARSVNIIDPDLKNPRTRALGALVPPVRAAPLVRPPRPRRGAARLHGSRCKIRRRKPNFN